MKTKNLKRKPQQQVGAGCVKRLVRRVDRSPLNAMRWCMELECGHEEWVTSKRRPTARTMRCRPCEGIKANTPNTKLSGGGPLSNEKTEL